MKNDENGPRISAVSSDRNRSPSLNGEAVVLEEDYQHCEEHEKVAEHLSLSEGESSGHSVKSLFLYISLPDGSTLFFYFRKENIKSTSLDGHLNNSPPNHILPVNKTLLF